MPQKYKKATKPTSRASGNASAARPQRNGSQDKVRSRYRKKSSSDASSLLLTVFGIVVVGLMVFFAFRLFSSGQETPSSDQSVGATTPSGINKGANSTPPPPPAEKGSSPWNNQEFVSTVMNHTAEKLGLSLDQLSEKVQSGMQIAEVAAQQGFSADQLHEIELEALQAGVDKLLSTDQITQDEADATMEHWRQRDPERLNGDFTYQLGGTPPRPANVTPTVLPR